MFEDYLPIEKVSALLKRQELVQGVIRINPRNFEDAYVSLPDGTADIYISGLSKRNRALNGDVVAVLPLEREKWRVYTNDLKLYEEEEACQRSPSPMQLEDPANQLDSDDSGPDVIEESIEEIDLTDKTVELTEHGFMSCYHEGAESLLKETDISLVNIGVGASSAVKRALKKCPASVVSSSDESLNRHGLPGDQNQDRSSKSDVSVTVATPAKSGVAPSTSVATDVLNKFSEGRISSAAEGDGLPTIRTHPEQDTTDLERYAFDVSSSSLRREQAAGHKFSIADYSSSSDNLFQDDGTFSTSHKQLSQSPKKAKIGLESPNRSKKDGNKLENRGGKQGGGKRRYQMLQDVLVKGSPVAKRLFSSDPSKPADTAQQGISDKFLQMTGKVVAVIERKHPRACSGCLQMLKDNNPNMVLFSPLDLRLPRILIPMNQCPKGFMEQPGNFANHLYLAQIVEWPSNSMYAKGQLMQSFGEAGEIEPETEAMLIKNDVSYSEFTPETLECLPQNLPWAIPEKEFHYRQDFRKMCVFTIDHVTARDLDDALSVEILPDGGFQVGVHIADVSYFVQEGTALDKIASQRATSVYLVQKVIPMLPRLLCEQLCSLNPDADHLTFSVVWKMNEDGEIYDEWFGKSIIRSCAKLSYDVAQNFIEEPDREWKDGETPQISGGFGTKDLQSRVKLLDMIAKKLRVKRFDAGALMLDQVKLQYTLDANTGLPNGYFVYVQKDSNRLVEEFMLLANMAVATKIYKCFPEKAMLRRHPPPQNKMLEDLANLSFDLGIPLDTTSSQLLQKSLLAYAGNDEYSLARMQVLVALCCRPMQLAKYFCTGMIADKSLYHHYALNVPFYTHFTSPIRRYPDVIVHRLLGAALGYSEEPEMNPKSMQVLAEHCNKKKLSAKRVSDLSGELYFAIFVKMCGPLEEKAMVKRVMDWSFDIFVLRLGVVKQVNCNALGLKSFTSKREKRKVLMTLVWPAKDGQPEQSMSISIFSLVNCILEADLNTPLKWNAIVPRPAFP